jgi:ribose transport system ATP-binding protein
VVDIKKEANVVKAEIDALNIRTPSARQLVQNLSGGNQQKVVLGKWLASDCKILILDEPTRGIDVGAKQEIYKLINTLAKNGLAIIVISSEMEEILNITDRMLVLFEGKFMGELSKDQYSQSTVLQLASGETTSNPPASRGRQADRV